MSAAPLTQTLTQEAPTVAQAVDGVVVIGRAPFAGTIAGVTYTAPVAVTGAVTDTRTLSVQNKGQAGSGTTVAASLALAAGVNLVAFDERALALSGTPANVAVAEGDIIEWLSTHNGAGVADPGGLVSIVFTRS